MARDLHLRELPAEDLDVEGQRQLGVALATRDLFEVQPLIGEAFERRGRSRLDVKARKGPGGLARDHERERGEAGPDLRTHRESLAIDSTRRQGNGPTSHQTSGSPRPNSNDFGEWLIMGASAAQGMCR